jgi:DNA topoisomerase-1
MRGFCAHCRHDTAAASRDRHETRRYRGDCAYCPTARKRAVTRVVKEVSEYLGNTPAVARSSYIDPRVIDRYETGRTIQRALDRLGVDTPVGHPATQGPVEAAVLKLLKGG